MPVEYTLLKDRPRPDGMGKCPKCSWGHVQPFMRGMVQSSWRRLFGLGYCAVICDNCKEIIGWERP